ncbi:MAG: M50 family metallopeptidase [Pseudomonadota bacterium]
MMNERASDLYVPSFVSVNYAGLNKGDAEYTVSNEASGRHFSANGPTVEFIEAIRSLGSLQHAAAQSRMPTEAAQALLVQLMRFGVVVQRGQTNQETTKAKAPFEARAVMIRFDLIDATPVVKHFAGVGRVLFSRFGLALWISQAILSLSALLLNQDKVALALSRVPDTGFSGVLAFAVLLILLKALHEMGHALAYQEMCRRAAIAPGPIRMGISIFALTPFPFTDVTGAWRLRSRKARAIIGAGGLYLEFFLIFVATLFWTMTGDGWLQTAIFHVVMFSALTSLIFNLNPAVKLDGYYILSDLLAFPNLAGRASQSAQAWLGRQLGADMPTPSPGLLAYWVISYLYRWVIFAGIFWLAYQLDPRLAAPVFGIVILMLVIRPLLRSVQHAIKRSARPRRLVSAGVLLVVLVIAGLVPFTDRVLLNGYLNRFETTFIRVPEPARLLITETDLPQLHSPELAHEQTDLGLQREIIQNANRAVAQSQSGVERARLETDLAQIAEMQENLAVRARTLTIAAQISDIWTPLHADSYAGSWVKPGQEILGALSTPVTPHLVLWMDQADFEVGLLADENRLLKVRMSHDPACEFNATLDRTEEDVLLRQGAIQMLAALPDPRPPCLDEVPSGAAVVARHPARPKSMMERGWRTMQRALQDRLPVELLLENEQRN